MIFGRGGEEAEWLAAHGIPFEIVPGVTAAAGAAAAAGIPLTHRAYASSLAVVTGHAGEEGECCPETGAPTAGRHGTECGQTWTALADGIDTLVIYMGMNHLGELCRSLIRYGRTPETPVAVVQWATTSMQKLVTGTLETIEQQVRDSGIGAPAVIIVGEVVRLREKMVMHQILNGSRR